MTRLPSAGLLARVLVATVILPGTVLAWIPWFWIVGTEGVAAQWPPQPGQFPAVAIVLAGSAIYLACAWNFATDGLGTPAPWDPPRTLVTGGLYRWTRNPMYVGIVGALIGEAWWFRSAPMAMYVGVMAVVFHLRVVLYEEPVLRKQFGAEFDAYCGHVKRWGVV